MNTVTIKAVNTASVGSAKIQIIKGVSSLTGFGLKESKDIVDAVDSGSQTFKTAADEKTVQDHLGGLCEYTFTPQAPLSIVIDFLRPYVQDESTGNLTVYDLYYLLKITHEAIGN